MKKKSIEMLKSSEQGGAKSSQNEGEGQGQATTLSNV